MPIGGPFDNMETVVVDEHLQEVPVGSDGELLVTGPQLSLGYWQDDEKTRRAFLQVPGRKLGTTELEIAFGREESASRFFTWAAWIIKSRCLAIEWNWRK